MAELEIEELCLSFGGLAVLDRVSLTVEPAELLALIGPNGAGKTSVLNCISGIYRGQGRIRFRGSDIVGLPSRAIARLGIARTFQHSELFRHMSVLERIIEFVELEGARYSQAGALPFGTQKLVDLARALALEPSLLLLDEPSAGLSRDERDDLARFILRIKHELKLPMIWIEHDMQMVADLADRIHVLDYGRTLASGIPEQVLKDPAVVAAYLGTRA